jgi:hypothetical protein
MVKGHQSLVPTDKCLTRTVDMMVKLLENVYKMVCELRLMYGAKIRRLEEGWRRLI